jgi:hypothetical protein
MKMSRWRTSTWAFIGWNVLMVGLVLAVGGRAGSETSGVDQTWTFAFLIVPVVFIWPIGLLVIGVARLLNRLRGGAQGPPTPLDMRTVTASDVDAVLADAAAIVVERKVHGKSLVEAAWMSKQRSGPDDPLRLNVAFGDPGVQYWALWPDDEDATEAVLARVPGIGEQDRPK